MAAISELWQESGTMYDPDVVAASHAGSSRSSLLARPPHGGGVAGVRFPTTGCGQEEGHGNVPLNDFSLEVLLG